MTTRRPRDFYETADWQVDALTDHLPELRGSICCPCVGDGSLWRRLRLNRPDLGPFVTNDLDATKAADVHGDARHSATWDAMEAVCGSRPDWVVENPSFAAEIDILIHAWEVCRVGVVFMGRVSFPEPTSATSYQGKPITPRGPWLSTHPMAKQITMERYSFTGDGSSDSATTAWMVWSKQPVAAPHLVSAWGYKAGHRSRR